MQSTEDKRIRGSSTESPPPRAPCRPGTTSATPTVTSPPFLQPVSVASDDGSHDYEDGDDGVNTSTHGGRSNSSPDISASHMFPRPGISGSTITSTPKPKRKRSMIACKNCNERRVRCDGATSGLPCSNCKHARKSDCQFIESKRVRGARGRFESRDGNPPATPPTASTKQPLAPSAGPSRPTTSRRWSISGTDGEEWRKLLQNSASVDRATTGPVTYLGESWHLSWVVQGQTDEKPLHLPTLMMENDGDVHNRVNKELWEKGAYVLPRYEVRDLLIAQYFEVCHPRSPILCKQTFLHSLQTNTFSHQLVQGVLMVAATHCDWAILQRAGYVSRREAIEGFYKRCRLLWDGDVEPDKITNIQTAFMMQFWWRAVTDHKDPLWWLTGAIRMAQSMGLHRSTERSRLNDRDKRIWRRLWWLLYLRDRQASSHFGKPMMINEKDCDIEDLEFDDLVSEVDRVQSLSLLQHLKLAKLVSSIIACEFSPGSARDLKERLQLRERCHHRLSEWQQALPVELVYQSNSKNLSAMCLQIAFLAQLLLLNRPVIYTDTNLPGTLRRPSEIIASNAADAITKISDDLIRMWGARYMSQHSMSCLFAAMTVQMIKRRSPDPKIAGDAERKLQQNMTNLVQLEKILPMAGWIHRRYSRILEYEGQTDEARAVSISPPALNGDVLASVPILPSRRSPPMHTITEENTNGHAHGGKAPGEDDWGNNCTDLLQIEHELGAPGHMGGNLANRQSFQHHQQQQQEGQGGSQGFGQSMPDTAAMQPELFDYHWFMENIGDIANPFWCDQQQAK